jgi:hypothetical protein
MSLRNILCVSVLAFAAAALATATPILFEDFNYPVGPLNGRNGGTGWDGGWVGPSVYSVAPGSLSYPGLLQSGNRAQFVPTNLAGTNALRTISSLGADGSTFWLSFLMSFDGSIDQSGADVRLDDTQGFGHFYIGRSRSDQNNWGVFDPVSSSTPYLSSIPIVSGVPIFVAVRFDLNSDPNLNDTLTVYFDPNPAAVPGANPGVPGLVFTDHNFASSGGVTMALDGSAFPFPTTFVANFDPIRGGTTYFDVAPASSSTTPEPATWTIVAAGLAFLGVATRRRTGR